MPIKTILVPLTDPQGASETLAIAFDLAAVFGAHVSALHLRSDPTRALVDFTGESISPAVVEQVVSDAESRSAALAAETRKAFDAVAGKVGARIGAGLSGDAPTASYREVVGESDYVIEEQGRLADLIVVRRARDPRDAAARIVGETALMGSARPVLLVPPRTSGKIGTGIAIAWNGSREAARAVAAALPFLTRAQSVTVVSVSERGEIDQQGLLDYLARHGVKAMGVKAKPGEDTGKAIVAAAVEADANLLVMGAYTHSRVRELIFGGVTEHALESARIPVLMVH